MEQSNFQFKNPRIEKIDFRVNDDESLTSEMPLSIDVESKVDKDHREAVTRLILTVGEVDDNNKVTTAFYFSGIMTSDFKWEEDIKNPEKMLRVSGGAVLLSYIRPVLSNITMQAGMKPLNLPFIDFTKE